MLGRRQMSAHSATALGRCAMSRVAAELRRFRSSVQRSFDSSVALQISIAACIPRAQTQYLLLAGLKHGTGLNADLFRCIAGNRLHCNGAAGTPPLQICALGALQISRLHCNDATHLKPG